MNFLQKPSARAWYRAHNSSIIAGYLEHRQLSMAELPVKRFFMDVALCRVLYVHALVIRPELALGGLELAGRSATRAGGAPTFSCRCATSCPTGIR